VDTLILSIGFIPNNDLLNAISCTMSKTRGAIVNQRFETDIDGIFSCGNVLHVHDLVDNVVAEAREAGKGAALYIQGKLPREDDVIIACVAGRWTGLCHPPEDRLGPSEDSILFKFRVRKPTKNVFIEYNFNGEVIKRVFKPVIIPSEMEIQAIPKNLLKNEPRNYHRIFEGQGGVTMANKEFICINCPRGCHLTVDEKLNVTGNFCPRGAPMGNKRRPTRPAL
jgi:hypothetical protein